MRKKIHTFFSSQRKTRRNIANYFFPPLPVSFDAPILTGAARAHHVWRDACRLATRTSLAR